MALTPADLRAVFQLEPKAAIAYLQRKGYRLSWNWQEMLDEAHARAFTVAKVARLDVLQDIRSALDKALQNGTTFRDFQRGLTPTLQAKGWWGRQIIVDSKGGAEVAKLGSPARLSTIFRTNLQSAYMAGRYQAMSEAADSHPYWEYVAVLDGRTRPSHRAMNGRVFKSDDPIWATCYPPNGFNCRCRVRPRSEGSLAKDKIAWQSSAGKLRTIEVDAGTDQRTGEIVKAQRTGIDLVDAKGKPVFFAPDAGFNASPMASHLMDDLLYRKAVAARPTRAEALAEVQAVLLSEPRQKAWGAFVDQALTVGRKQGQDMAMGVLSEVDIAFVEAQGKRPASGIVYVEDKLLAGAKAQRHAAAGNALSREEWLGLPQAFAQPETVLWDVNNETVLYVLPSGDGRKAKVAVRFARFGKEDAAATVFKVPAESLDGGLKSGDYRKIR